MLPSSSGSCAASSQPPAAEGDGGAQRGAQRSARRALLCALYAAILCSALLPPARAAEDAGAHPHREHPRMHHHRRRNGKEVMSGRALTDSGGSTQVWYRKAGEMGVYQYEIPGVIELENGAREAVVIHLYLKGLQNGDTVTYRGSMFAESAEWEWYNWGGTGLCQPQITANWWPRVFFREVAQQEREHDFRVYKEVMFDEMAEPDIGTEEERYRVCTPYPFELNMTGPDALLDFELHIDNLKNFVYYSPNTVHKPVPRPPAPAEGQLPEVVALLVPFLHPTPQEAANNLLFLYVQYHRPLGFAKFVQYTQSTFLGGFLADERLRRLVAEGLLEFVLWDGTTECTDHLKCFQPVMYSHAVLAFWGANVYLSMADHDEYLALPNPERATSVQDLIGRCFDGQSQARPRFRRPSDRVNLKRYNIVCGGERCQSKDGHNEDNDDIELTAELDLWTGPVGAGHRHPLEHYTLRAIEPFTDDRGKCMVHPEHMAGFQVHYGMVLPSGKVHQYASEPFGVPIPEDCAVWLHMVNLFTGRDDRSSGTFRTDHSWQWVFNRHLHRGNGTAPQHHRARRALSAPRSPAYQPR